MSDVIRLSPTLPDALGHGPGAKGMPVAIVYFRRVSLADRARRFWATSRPGISIPVGLALGFLVGRWLG